jgi:hypothetical protein
MFMASSRLCHEQPRIQEEGTCGRESAELAHIDYIASPTHTSQKCHR